MVITDAVDAGAVSIAFGGGGIPEMIQHGQNGYLWSDFDGLRRATLRAVRGETIRQGMAAAAERVREFSAAAFEARLFKLLAPDLNS